MQSDKVFPISFDDTDIKFVGQNEFGQNDDGQNGVGPNRSVVRPLGGLVLGGPELFVHANQPKSVHLSEASLQNRNLFLTY
jgi:hypothetical protein